MHSKSSFRVLLLLVVAAYVAIGALYAAFTPTWQIPDEPAHYNYVRSLAEGRGFPVLERGNYDQDYLGRLRSEDFPPELPIDSLEYEDHQPPLYYLLAAPVYRLFDGAVLPLRLLSVALGAALLAVAFGAVRAIFPARPDLALMTAAFIAFIPQHVAMTAGVNNDALAELVVGGTLWALVAYVSEGGERPWPIGLLLAAAAVTKTTAYAVFGVAVAAVATRWRHEHRSWRWAGGQVAWMLIPALLLSAPWFVRNGLTYGWRDPLGLSRHEAVVEGQMRSSEYLAEHGWGGLLRRFFVWTFRSFWGQFGWLKVVLPARFYWALLLFSALLGLGFLWWLFDPRRASPGAARRAGSVLLPTLFGFTLLEYLGYNLSFLQHQGRYLFPALIPIGTAAALGLDRLTGILTKRLRILAITVLFTGLAAFDIYCLFKHIIPYLTR